MEPASFINLDLELSADKPLDALALHLEKTSFILFNDEIEHGYRLVAEPIINGKLSTDAVACTEHFLTAIRTLPHELREIWNECSARVFDYGFDGGLENPPLSVTLQSVLLLELAQRGIDVRVTIYPFQEETNS